MSKKNIFNEIHSVAIKRTFGDADTSYEPNEYLDKYGLPKYVNAESLIRKSVPKERIEQVLDTCNLEEDLTPEQIKIVKDTLLSENSYDLMVRLMLEHVGQHFQEWMISIYETAKRYSRFKAKKKTKPRGMSPKIKARNDNIRKDWITMLKEGPPRWTVTEICEKLGKKYDMKPDTVRTEFYSSRG